MMKSSGITIRCAVFFLGVTSAIAVRAQSYTKLADFNGANGGDPKYMSLVQGRDGRFYGTTTDGGQISCAPYLGCGVVFAVTPEGKIRTLHVFKFGDNDDGIWPIGGLVLATDGNFYGTATYGGKYDGGAIFKITPSGAITTIYSFCAQGQPCIDGATPYAGLIEGPDGSFFGTTVSGGTNTACFRNCGTVFKVTKTGDLTTLANFCVDIPCVSGPAPYGALVLGNDGNFYGTTYSGGGTECESPYPSCGTVFRVTPTGTLTTLHSFQGFDGGNPTGGLVLGDDGNFYGSTSAPFGAHQGGTVFRINLAGVLTTLYDFCAQPQCADGIGPFGTLIEATDGNFYGTTTNGGTDGSCDSLPTCGTVFQITANGSMTTVFQSFNDVGGFYPRAGLLQGTDGILYGTTYAGGDLSCGGSNYGGCGTIFSLDLGLRSYAGLLHNPARRGQSFGILGQGLTGTTLVAIQGVPVSFNVVSDTFIKAIVPSNAITGYVTVTTPTGVLSSNVRLHVIP